MKYLVIYEQADDGGFTAYAPELQPGAVVSTGRITKKPAA